MNNKSLIKIIDFWQKASIQNKLYNRDILEKIDTTSKEVVDIVGPRRSGKSSVLKLLIKKLKERGNQLYINFEDPFFVEHSSPQVIEELIEIYKEYFKPSLRYLFFDEVQNIKNWETAIRKLRDSGQYKIFITGSSSKLLSSELSTLLSGRHLSYTLLPLSFPEYLLFNDVKITKKRDLILKEKSLLKHFNAYLFTGGFPEIVLSGNQELIKQYYTDIIQKDIIMRYDVREKNIMEKMGIFLISNAAKTVSFSQLKNLYKISYELATTYLEYFKESFLLFELPQFSYSLKTQQKSFKKIYAIDTGLANAVSFRFSEDKGRILENAVFIHLKRLGVELYYYKANNQSEVDFIIKNPNGKMQLIQVAWNLEDDKTKTREQKGLRDAIDELKVKSAILLTYDTRDTLVVRDINIPVMPVYEWILENEIKAFK